jgi:hypothetical protein
MRPPPPVAADQFGVFTTEQALANGWTVSSLRNAVSTGSLLRLRRGVLVASEAPEGSSVAGRQLQVVQSAAAAVLAVGTETATLSHATAAVVLGLPILRPLERACLNVPRDHTAIAGIHRHRRVISHVERLRIGTISVTAPARTCLDVAREDGLLAGLITTDAALHNGLISLTDLEDAYGRLRGRGGLHHGRALMGLARAESESPLESLSRYRLRDLRPQPRLQVVLRDRWGDPMGRCDFYWDDLGLVGEADGRAKYTLDEHYREKVRQERIEAEGLLFTRWNWSVANEPGRLMRQITASRARTAELRSSGYSFVRQ